MLVLELDGVGAELVGVGVDSSAGTANLDEVVGDGDGEGDALLADITMVTAEAEATMPTPPMPKSTLVISRI